MGRQQACAAPLSVSAGPDTGAPADGAGLTLAGLIDVLDRADEVRIRARPRRPVAHRSPTVRIVSDRWDPLRTVTPPSAALSPRRPSIRAVPVRPVPQASAARLPAGPAAGTVALGGATSDVAPHRSAAVSPAPPAPRPAAPSARRLRGWVQTLVRRAALWGAGPAGSHLAWGAPPPRPVPRPVVAVVPSPRRSPHRPVDPPVVLREMPSTPTTSAPTGAPLTRPVASSPAAVPAPPRPASAGGRSTPGGPARRQTTWVRPVATSAARSSGSSSGRVPGAVPPGLSARTCVPARARAPAPSAGIRGSPDPPPARGSPAARLDTG